jgi:AcrR family transcriptional regulator
MVGRPRVRRDHLDEQAIVGAAVKLARNRLAELTMRTLANELEVSVGALYKHVSGRDELLAMVVDAVLDRAPRMGVDVGDGWLALRAQVLGVQALLDRYPGLDEAVTAHSPRSPKADELRREGMAALQRERLSADDAHKVYRAVTWLWLGSRTALEGRARRRADIDTFAEALDILIAGLKAHLKSTEEEKFSHTQPHL